MIPCVWSLKGCIWWLSCRFFVSLFGMFLVPAGRGEEEVRGRSHVAGKTPTSHQHLSANKQPNQERNKTTREEENSEPLLQIHQHAEPPPPRVLCCCLCCCCCTHRALLFSFSFVSFVSILSCFSCCLQFHPTGSTFLETKSPPTLPVPRLSCLAEKSTHSLSDPSCPVHCDPPLEKKFTSTQLETPERTDFAFVLVRLLLLFFSVLVRLLRWLLRSVFVFFCFRRSEDELQQQQVSHAEENCVPSIRRERGWTDGNSCCCCCCRGR